MKFFKPLLIPCILAPVFAINACKKLPNGEITPKKSNTPVAIQDTSYTDLESGIRIFKVNHSDILPIAVDIDFINSSGYHGTVHEELSGNKEDSLMFNGGGAFISKGNYAQIHSDTSIIFNSKVSDRLRIHRTRYGESYISIVKPENKNTKLSIEWLNNDITDPYDAEKERQRANATISAITDGKVVFWVSHP